MTSLLAPMMYRLLVTIHLCIYVCGQFPPDDTLTVYGTEIGVCSSTHLCQPDDRCGSIPDEARECGCDSACEYYGDCCYDYWSACKSDLNPSTVAGSSQLECTKGDDFLEFGYYVIAFCRDDSTVNIDTIDKCENPGSGDILLEILVSDTEDNIYKNVYCALCNDVPITEVTAWEVTFVCDEEEVGNEFGETFEPAGPAPPPPPFPPTVTTQTPPTTEAPPPNIHEQLGNSVFCPYVNFKPPSGKEDTRRPCYMEAISECNDNYMNVSVIQACMTKYKAIVYDGNVYMNPHCAICNNGQYYTCTVYDTQPSRVGFTDLTVIVDFSAGSSISVDTEYGSYVNEGVSCAAGEVFDPFTNQCLKLTCKDGYILEGSKCVTPSILSGCGDSALHIPSEVFCECKLQEQSLHVEYEYIDNDVDMFTTVDDFTQDLKSLDVSFTKNCFKMFNMTVITISIEDINCQLAYDVYELITKGINNNTDAQLGVVTFRQNCSTNSIPNELLCDHDSVILMEGDELDYDNITRTIRVDNSSIQIPEDEYLLELVHEFGNESSICNRLSILTCDVCPQIQLDTAAFQDQDNGTLIYEITGDIFEEHQYSFSVSSNSSLFVCSFLNQTGTTEAETQFFNYSGALLIISVIGTIISLISLLITILLRAIIAELRTPSGKIILNVSIALFCALLLTLLQGNFTEWRTVCNIVAAILHYLWLVCFCWMNAMAVELFQTFRKIRGSSRSSRSKESQRKSFIRYFIYSWGLPALYVGVIVAISLCECTSLDVMYGDDSVCWIRDELASLYVFGIPLAMILVPNLILFVATITGIRKSMKSTAAVRSGKSDDNQQTGEMIIYIRISTIMGLTWGFGFLASFIDHVVLWYLFTILNSLQGFFIFVAFNINYSMKNIWNKRREKETSTQPKTKETSLMSVNQNAVVKNNESEPLNSTRL